MRRLARQALKAAAAFLALAAVLGSTSCALARRKAEAPKEAEVKAACPQAKVLVDARSIVQFQPGVGRDLTDIQYQAQVSSLRSRCKARGGGKGQINITLGFNAWLGPAAIGQAISLPYFVAVTRGEDVILKESFTADVSFDEQARQTSFEAEVKRLPLPLAPSEQAVEVLVGIQLTPEQVAYNRAHGS